MQYIGPLIQTALWVALVGFIVWRFYRPLHSLLTALAARLEAGSSIKAGPFEIGEIAKPLSPEQQRIKADTELKLALAAPEGEAPIASKQVKSRFLQAEELAVRAVQAEFDRPISREVSLGAGLAVDGAFTVDGKLWIVEVKYVVRPQNAVMVIERSLEYLSSAIERYHFRNVGIVFVLVFEFPLAASTAKEDFAPIFSRSDVEIEPRYYSLAELREQFGFPAQDGG